MQLAYSVFQACLLNIEGFVIDITLPVRFIHKDNRLPQVTFNLLECAQTLKPEQVYTAVAGITVMVFINVISLNIEKKEVFEARFFVRDLAS